MKIRILLVLGLSVIFAGCISSFSNPLGLSPHWDWKTMESKHFRLTYPAELQQTAQDFAKHLEDAHTLLSPRLHWEPANRVQVLVIDNTDSANGMAAAVGRFGMVMIATPPDNWFSTYYYEDWLRMLAIHEYTHFLNMDATKGVLWESMRLAFGDVALPNSTWPSWMLEGMAVYMETRFSTGGRGRSPYYDMIVRSTATEQGELDNDIMLDRVNGVFPYFPYGETPYLFGYQLVNTFAMDNRERLPLAPGQKGARITADGEQTIGEDDVLGVLSERSSEHVPYFVNREVEGVFGNDWNAYWRRWVSGAKLRAEAQLAHIKEQPVTTFERLTAAGQSIQGPAVSPNGRWVAFTLASSDRRTGLYVLDTKTGEKRRLADKLMGATLSFTADSKNIVFSSLRRQSNYEVFSELGVWDIEEEKIYWLSEGLRGRDPDISPDGRTVAFTKTENSTTGLAIAALAQRDGSRVQLGETKTLFMPSRYGRVSTPRFSPDGKRIAFSYHPNGVSTEQIMEIDVQSGQTKTLVATKGYHRFPTYSPDGRLYFISDITGIDNLYEYLPNAAPRAVTNVTTGIWFPSFGRDGTLYAAVFSSTGWQLGRLSASALNGKPTTLVSFEAAPAPAPAPMAAPAATGATNNAGITAPAGDYSVWPSILPRAWSPLLSYDGASLFAGGQVMGFDALDLHRYWVSAGWDTGIQKADWSVAYSNRSFGPTLSVMAGNRTNSYNYSDTTSELLEHTRLMELSAVLSYPIESTYSVLTPAISVNAEREALYGGTNSPAQAWSRFVPSADASVSYSNAESSQLAISAERGHNSALGARLYLDGDKQIWKGLVAHQQYFSLGSHWVLTPALRAEWSTKYNNEFVNSNVLLSGRINRLLDPMPGTSFDELGLRGYPGRTFVTRGAALPSLELRFPLAQVFHGWGTAPVFLRNIWGFTFGEVAYVPRSTSQLFLPSAGGGLKLSSDLMFYVPVVFALEYHHGFNVDYGGKGEIFAGFNVSALRF